MATTTERKRRLALMSAPPMCRLPRVDTSADRLKLITTRRRIGTAKLRREYIESRQAEFEASSSQNRNLEELKRYKAYIDRVKLLGNSRRPVTRKKETDWTQEVTKCNVPERLAISVPIRLSLSSQPHMPVEVISNKTSIFYKADTERRTVFDEHYGRCKLQYIINKEWASEKYSWKSFHRNVPAFHKVSCVC